MQLMNVELRLWLDGETKVETRTKVIVPTDRPLFVCLDDLGIDSHAFDFEGVILTNQERPVYLFTKCLDYPKDLVKEVKKILCEHGWTPNQ